MAKFDTTAAEDFSGKTILDGHLHLVKRLGSGAFGAVYLAYESALGQELRTVAVKLTHRSGLSDADAREVLQEGFVLCRVLDQCKDQRARQHLIHVYRVGIVPELGRLGCLVMEHVAGAQLKEHIFRFGPSLPSNTARRYFREMCRAVSACHRCQPAVTHGDLKPDNVLVDVGGTLRIVDFGLARPVDRFLGFAVSHTQCLAYTAPETLLGQSRPQSDIYSLGLVMFEVLTGGGPHLMMPPGPPIDSQWHYYDQKKSLVFPQLEEACKTIQTDERLFRIVEKCCHFDYRDRFQSIDEVLAELDELIDGVPTSTKSLQGSVATDTRSSEKPSTPRSVPNWEEEADRFLKAGCFEGCLRFLETVEGGHDDRLHGYRAICLGQREPFAVAEGQHILEIAGTHLDRLPTRWPWYVHLCEALTRAADAVPGMEPYAAYYREQAKTATPTEITK